MNPSSRRTQALPVPDPDALAHMQRVAGRILDEIDALGFLPFERYMELALYAPGLGYYAAGAAKFGRGGDFVTAPEISPLFGAALARQVGELIERGCGRVLELGAGTGSLAGVLLTQLRSLGCPPCGYDIVERSADLRERQRATLARVAPDMLDRTRWLDTLPASTEAIVIGNEILDALPVSLVRMQDGRLQELGVVRSAHGRGETFAWASRPADEALQRQAAALQLPDGYTTELHGSAQALVRTLAATLTRGVVLFIDYGFPASEYYHPQRADGTLMCHYRHRAHPDPLCLPGLQDITAHVDFSALANTAEDAGLELLGYTQQARFLMNCGILELLSGIDAAETDRYLPACAGVQKLLSPAEMGELFKVIAFGRGIAPPLLGFATGDRSGAL